MSSLEESIAERERSLVHALYEKRSGIDDRTGKGQASERIIERELLKPYLPPGFDCSKGSVVSAEAPSAQSEAIDRVVFDRSAAPPLLFDEAHSIFAIESISGLIEITMRLDATKLRKDIERMAPTKAMRTRRYLAPHAGSKTKVAAVEKDEISVRSFVVGLPADPSWDPRTIAQSLRQIQVQLGPPTHVHGLYVIGIGFFYTHAVENENEPMYRIGAYIGPDRLFRFTDTFRRSFDRWGKLYPGWSVDLGRYVSGESSTLAD